MSASTANRFSRVTRSPFKARVVKRVLIVNAFFDDRRLYMPYPRKVPQAMAPFYLAGAFSRNHCEVRVFDEHHSGPLQDAALLGWPDMLVLTGLTISFDRMLHLTAYARTKNPKVIVVAGGPAVRALPRNAERFFDHSCLGDIEQMQEIIGETFGTDYTAPEIVPRYDLFHHLPYINYLESSRNCNFSCSFCSLTGEGNRYRKYSLETVRRQIDAIGPTQYLCFIDNNFYGNNRDFFLERLELLKHYKAKGQFKGWAGLVTQDFFMNDDNLKRARESGCVALFSGIESFNAADLDHYNKRQNNVPQQMTVIRKCLDAGIVFLYGLMFDLATRTVADLNREFELILDTPGVTLPAYTSLSIPLPGTPYFQECVATGGFLPQVKLRDLDGFTLTQKPLDPLEKVVPFVADLETWKQYRWRAFKKVLEFVGMYGRRLDAFQLRLGASNALSLCAFQLLNAKDPFRSVAKLKHRTYVSTTEPLDPIYRPMIRVASRYAHHFKPIAVTDEAGQLSRAFLLDYQPNGHRRSAARATPGGKGVTSDMRPRISFAVPSKSPLPADAVRSRSAIASIKPKHGPSASPAKGPRVRVAGH